MAKKNHKKFQFYLKLANEKNLKTKYGSPRISIQLCRMESFIYYLIALEGKALKRTKEVLTVLTTTGVS